MNLQRYLSENNISVQDFAKEIGVSRQQVYNYMSRYDEEGNCIPRPSVMERIFKATNYQVPPPSFYFDARMQMEQDRRKNQRKRRPNEKSAGNTEVGESE